MLYNVYIEATGNTYTRALKISRSQAVDQLKRMIVKHLCRGATLRTH